MEKVMEFVLDVISLIELVEIEMLLTAFSGLSLYNIHLGENVITCFFWFVAMTSAMTLDALVIRDVWRDVTMKYDTFKDVTEEIEA